MTKCLGFSTENFNRSKEREREMKEGNKEGEIKKVFFLIMLNLGDGLCEVHHIILLVCILKFFIKKVFSKKLNQCLAHNTDNLSS